MLALILEDARNGLFVGHLALVGPLDSDGIIGITKGKDSGLQGDLFSL